jgi:hypothetical protein
MGPRAIRAGFSSVLASSLLKAEPFEQVRHEAGRYFQSVMWKWSGYLLRPSHTSSDSKRREEWRMRFVVPNAIKKLIKIACLYTLIFYHCPMRKERLKEQTRLNNHVNFPPGLSLNFVQLTRDPPVLSHQKRGPHHQSRADPIDHGS